MFSGTDSKNHNFFNDLCSDPEAENAWLECLAHMETMAAKQIRGNLSRHTPDDIREEILAHAADEDRHAETLLAMRTPQGAPTELSNKMKHLGESFVMGYFGNTELLKAKNRHAAYAHGAITIEQFPFQIYTTYLRYTKNEKTLSYLPSVIQDEHDHIALGRKMLECLPEEEKLSVVELMKVEKSMCQILMTKMADVLREYQSPSQVDDGPLESILKDNRRRVAWYMAVARAEVVAAEHMQRLFTDKGRPIPERMHGHVEDERLHCELIREGVILERWRLRHDKDYRRQERYAQKCSDLYLLGFFKGLLQMHDNSEVLYVLGSMALERRVLKHYGKLVQKDSDILMAHNLTTIIEDEKEHLKMQKDVLPELEIPSELLKKCLDLESEHFDRFICRVGAH